MAAVYAVLEKPAGCDIPRRYLQIEVAGKVVTAGRRNEQEVDDGNDCVG